MPQANLFNIEGKEIGKVQLNPSVFDRDVNESVVHQALLAQLANKRTGNADTKTRADVRGGGAKPFRQKGTGRARQGTYSAPHMIGGGVVFGPHPRDYSQKMNRKAKRLAYCSILSDKVKNNHLLVLENAELKTEKPKTKEMVKMMENMKLEGKVLFIFNKEDENAKLSLRNIHNVRIINRENINVFDLLKYDRLVMTQDVLKQLEEVLSNESHNA